MADTHRTTIIDASCLSARRHAGMPACCTMKLLCHAQLSLRHSYLFEAAVCARAQQKRVHGLAMLSVPVVRPANRVVWKHLGDEFACDGVIGLPKSVAKTVNIDSLLFAAKVNSPTAEYLHQAFCAAVQPLHGWPGHIFVILAGTASNKCPCLPTIRIAGLRTCTARALVIVQQK